MYRSASFYDEVLAVLGAKRSHEFENTVIWSTDTDQPSFSVLEPYYGKPATLGNGTMVALAAADDEEQVRQVHAKELEMGGTDDGAPGPRFDGAVYAAYFRDLDGNKLEVILFK